jgi:hypothetical protein
MRWPWQRREAAEIREDSEERAEKAQAEVAEPLRRIRENPDVFAEAIRRVIEGSPR